MKCVVRTQLSVKFASVLWFFHFKCMFHVPAAHQHLTQQEAVHRFFIDLKMTCGSQELKIWKHTKVSMFICEVLVLQAPLCPVSGLSLALRY